MARDLDADRLARVAALSLWSVEDYLRLRTGGDDPGLDLFAERFVRPGTHVLDVGCGPKSWRKESRGRSRSWRIRSSTT